MKFQISPLIRKIANVGITIALINNGADSQVAARYGQLAEGLLSGITLKESKEDVITRLQRTFIDSTFQVLKYKVAMEIEYETARGLANDLFNLDNLYQYLKVVDSELLLINKFKECCVKYNIPFVEQELDVDYIVEKIIFKINNYIINDIHFLLIVLLINSNESRQDIIDIKESGVELCNNKQNPFKYNQKNQFIDKWKKNLFLHEHIMLCDIYTHPNFNCNQYKADKIEKLLLNYLADNSRYVLFLFGNPGLGKSSLMSYVANMFVDMDDYLFIRMHDLDPRIAKSSLIDAIIDFLECKRRDLANTVIFLDGYDELRVDSKHYDLCLDFIAELKQIKSKAIISSRLNYIDLNKSDFKRDFSNAVVVELQPFNKQQMFEYIERFAYFSKEPIDIVKERFNRKTTEIGVYGIPFILYLICSLKIDINEMTDMQSIYDKVFSFDGGLYDKIYDEESGHYLTQNPQCKKDLLQISMEIAYRMFKTDKLFVEIESLDQEIISKYPQRKNTYAIGNYYNIENDRLYFVHKTFQEYFTCRFLLDTLEKLLRDYLSNQFILDEVAKQVFDMLYCENYLFKRIEHIFYNMFLNSHLKVDKEFKEVFIKLAPRLYDLYIRNIYFDTGTKNNILKSQNYLSSIHKIINFFEIDTFTGVEQNDVSYILRNKFYVIMNIFGLILDNIDLSGAYLRGTFNNCNFKDVNFCRCDLHNSIINSSSMCNCKLDMIYGRNTSYNNVKLFNYKLAHSNMTYVKFNQIDFEESVIREVNFSNSVFNQIIFKNTRFVECDFSYVKFNDIKGNIMFYECTFLNSKFVNVEGDIYFHDCDDDYEILEPKDNKIETVVIP